MRLALSNFVCFLLIAYVVLDALMEPEIECHNSRKG